MFLKYAPMTKKTSENLRMFLRNFKRKTAKDLTRNNKEKCATLRSEEKCDTLRSEATKLLRL